MRYLTTTLLFIIISHLTACATTNDQPKELYSNQNLSESNKLSLPRCQNNPEFVTQTDGTKININDWNIQRLDCR